MDNQDYKLNSSFSYLVILAVLIALGVAGRLLPHPPNFTPMAAIALFAGFIFVKRYMAIVAVVVTMLLCDYFAFGSLSANWFGSKSMFVVYLALLFPIVFKNFLQRPNRLYQSTNLSSTNSASVERLLASQKCGWPFSPPWSRRRARSRLLADAAAAQSQ